MIAIDTEEVYFSQNKRSNRSNRSNRDERCTFLILACHTLYTIYTHSIALPSLSVTLWKKQTVFWTTSCHSPVSK